MPIRHITSSRGKKVKKTLNELFNIFGLFSYKTYRFINFFLTYTWINLIFSNTQVYFNKHKF